MKDDIVLVHASNMADIFEENIRYMGGEAYLNNEGLNALGEYFDSVEYELRTPVFEWLLIELNKRGVDYDTDMFNVGSVN